MQERLRAIIRQEVKEARDRMAQRASGVMASDPRGTAQAVRHSIYRDVLGGQINIFNGKGGGGGSSYTKPRKLDSSPNQRGGNRRPRSAKTERMESYGGTQRGMVLRWLNDGVNDRKIQTSRNGNRGSISARNWFGSAGDAEMNAAAERIMRAIDEEIALF
jgi:hypothetical protein